MARPLRLEFEGALYHITSRGNDRQVIFFEQSDRLHFLESLAPFSLCDLRPKGTDLFELV